MMNELERQLKHALLTHPQQFAYHWGHASICDLKKLLFRSLAADRDDYFRLFFPNGAPPDQSEPWSLKAAQGAVEGAEYLPSAKGTACGHIFKSGESTYTCKTCAADDTCVLCARCFESSDHDGHQVYISVSPGNSGCCDCGDKEAWRREVICSIHSETVQEVPSQYGKAKASEAPLGSSLPVDLVEAIRMTLARVCDYLCDVFSCSPEQLRLPKTVESVERDEERSRLSQVYGQEPLENHEYCLVLWNDEKHTVDDVQNQVARACSKTKKFGLEKAMEVNDVGRSVVHYSDDIQELIRMAEIIEQLKVTVTIRSARDTYREEMCATIIDWISDISGCAVGNEHYLLRNVVCEEFLRPWRLGSEAGNQGIGLAGIDDHELEDNEKLRRRYRSFIRPPPAATVVRVDVETEDDDLDDNENDNNDEDDNEEEIDVDDDMEMEGDGEGMEIEIEDIREAANAALNEAAAATAEDMDVDFGEDDQDITEALEATIAGYPPPPAPPRARQRSTILTPAESDDGDAQDTTPTLNAPFENVPRTPKAKGVIKRASRPSKHWLEKPEGYRAPRPSEPCEDLWQRVRLDWLILYDLRLWKTLRIHLRHLYITTVVTIPHFKRILGLRFAGLYTPLAELYLIADREPDHSIINLSVQMLTTPTITQEVVERGNFLTNLMAILYTFLTTRQVGFPEEVSPKATLAFDAGAVTNRRMFHFFLDLRWLFQSEFIHWKMRTEARYMLQFLDLVKLHQGVCPNVRATGEHVEYESDAWISASMIVKEVNKLCKQVAVSFEPRLDPNDGNTNLQRAIRQVAQVTMINSFGYERKRFQQAELKDDLAWHSVGPFESAAAKYSVPRFVVQTEPMSFHHPLHYLLSWLIEDGKDMSRDAMRALLSFSENDLKDPWNPSRYPTPPADLTSDELLCGIFDHPLRVCSWLAQMKAGMWVRNGITLRHQAHTYRSVSHRDIGYQRDLLMVQAGLVLCGSKSEKPGERFLAQMMDRFQMTAWMNGDFAVVPGFEEAQQLDVLEDFYHLLVIALSERSNLVPGTDATAQHDKVLQHDISHSLCFKPLSFSDLASRVTEKVGESDDFNRVLESMTLYRPPEGMSDTGTFELKPEFIELIDPYYAHYSRNHREEAENIYKKHMARKIGMKIEDVVFEPKLEAIETGLFKDLAAFTRTTVFVRIVNAALEFALDAPVHAPKIQSTRIETFLHMVFHLTLIATLEDGNSESVDGGFVNLASVQEAGNTPRMLAALLNKDEYASCHPAIRQILRKMQQRQPQKINTYAAHAIALDRKDTGSPASLSAEDKEKKKQEALARQARVMAQMKQQQNSFLQNQGLSGYDDDFEDIEDDMSITDEPESMIEERKTWSFPTGTCILCQEETDDQRLYGTFAFLGESNILRSTPTDYTDFVQEVLDTPTSLDRSAQDVRPFGVAGKNKYTVQKVGPAGNTVSMDRQGLSKGFPQQDHSIKGPVATGCGHIMHYSCFELYLAATHRRHTQQIARNHPERIEAKEFICPLCKALGNTFMPIIWKAKECAHEHELHAAKGFADWLVDSASFYRPNLAFLESAAAAKQHQEHGQNLYSQRSSKYVNNMFAPPLVASMRELSLNTPPAIRAEPAPVLRRGSSLSNWFPRFGRNDSSPAAVENPGLSPMTGQSEPRMTELSKAYQRIDDAIRANRLTSPVEDGRSNPVSPLSRALGFSISSIEIAYRGAGNDPLATSLLGDLPESVVTHLRILSETIESYLAVHILRPSVLDSIPRETSKKRDIMIAQLFGPEESNREDMWMIKVKDYAGSLLFQDDIFLFFADWLSLMAPDVAEASSILQLCYWAEVVKVIYVYKGLLKQHEIPTTDASRQTPLSEAFKLAVQGLSSEDTRDPYSRVPMSDAQLETLRSLVDTYALTFLRKSMVLMYIRYGLEFECPYNINPEASETERLTSLLHMPSLEDMCNTYNAQSAAGRRLKLISSRWISQANMITEHSSDGRNPITLSHPTIFELVGLPKNYDTLTEEAIKRRCPTTGKEVTDPAVCLFCGDIFCSQAVCCMKNKSHGGCYQHMQKCGGKVGIFINIRKCMVLFMHGPSNGSYAHAPYLDKHGEPDPTLRKHHQLYLHQKRYDKLLREVWLNHMIPTVISRKLEGDINPGGWETL